MKFDLLLFNERAKDRQSIPIISFCLIFRPNLFLKMLHFSSIQIKNVQVNQVSERWNAALRSITCNLCQSWGWVLVPCLHTSILPYLLLKIFFFLSPLLICQLFQFIFFFFSFFNIPMNNQLPVHSGPSTYGLVLLLNVKLYFLSLFLISFFNFESKERKVGRLWRLAVVVLWQGNRSSNECSLIRTNWKMSVNSNGIGSSCPSTLNRFTLLI